MSLPVIILAGGLATRLRPATDQIPKALLPICGEPFLAHQLRLLASRGIERAVLSVGYRGGMIEEFAGDGSRFGLRVECVPDGPRLLGTAGAIKQALSKLGPRLGDAFLTLYGDSYLPCDYAAVEGAFAESGQSALMTVYENNGQWDSSNVEFRDGRILVYDKRARAPGMRHIDYGLGVFRREAFDAVPEGEPHDLAALYQSLVANGRLAGHEMRDRFYEIGTPEGIRETESYLCGKGTRA